MVTSVSLRDRIDQQIGEIESIAANLDDATASARPADGEWNAKEILSHLAGREGVGEEFARIKRFVEEDNPVIDLVPGVSHYDGSRPEATVAELVAAVSAEYRGLGDWLAGLSDEQLQRTAQIPFLKQANMDEEQTLGTWVGFVAGYHLQTHIDQLRALSA